MQCQVAGLQKPTILKVYSSTCTRNSTRLEYSTIFVKIIGPIEWWMEY